MEESQLSTEGRGARWALPVIVVLCFASACILVFLKFRGQADHIQLGQQHLDQARERALEPEDPELSAAVAEFSAARGRSPRETVEADSGLASAYYLMAELSSEQASRVKYAEQALAMQTEVIRQPSLTSDQVILGHAGMARILLITGRVQEARREFSLAIKAGGGTAMRDESANAENVARWWRERTH